MSDKKPKTIDASCPVSFMGCEGEVIVEMTPTEAVLMIEKAWQENKRLRQENASLTAERDKARRRVCEDAIRHGGVYRRVGRETVRCETPQEVAEIMEWDCFKEATDE